MLNRKSISLLVSMFAGAAIAIVPTTQAVASDTASGSPSATIVDPGDIPEGTYIAPGVDLSDPIISLKGHPTELDSENVHASKPPDDVASAACGPYAAYAPPFTWSTWKAGCSVLGWDDSATKGYHWGVPAWSDGQACAQGKGFHPSGAYWISLGCGTGGNGTVHWGNVIAYPKFKNRSIAAPLGCPTSWT